jgi:hypothetical protein
VVWDDSVTFNHGSNSPLPLRGRISWHVFDCSGLLDANRTMGATRGPGTNLAEVVPFEIANPVTYVNERTKFTRFETVPEVWDLTKTAHSTPPFTNTWTQFPFSYFPLGWFDNGAGAVVDPIDISVDLASQRSAIQTAFTDAGFPEPAMITDALIDYTDADDVPLNLFSFSMEAVPMINEIALINEVEVTVSPRAGTTTWVNRVTMEVELWYPFGNTNNNTYTVAGRLRSQGGLAGFNWDATENFTLLDPVAQTTPWPFDHYHTATNSFEKTLVNPATPPSDPFGDLPATIALDFTLVDNSSSDIVDQVRPFVLRWRGPRAAFPLITFPTVPLSGTASTMEDSFWEVNDPRMNWDFPSQWVSSRDGSLGDSNTVRTVFSDADADGHFAMWVRNGPLVSLGELGWLPYDPVKPWWTIRFLQNDPDGTAQVLDRFTVDTNTTGFVNLNSQQTNALAAVFRQAPIELYPGAPGSTAIADTNAVMLAGRILINGPYINLSGMAKNDVSDFMGLPEITNALEAESAVRNSIGLLRTRQNLMTVYLGAQVLAANTDEVVADARAVAVVWRDPFPNPDGFHPSFVRYFKWLTELK